MRNDREIKALSLHELAAAMYDDDAPRDVQFTPWASQSTGVRTYWLSKAERIFRLIDQPRTG